MALEAAPYFADVAAGSVPARAYWLKTPDGLRIRMAHWTPDAPRGTVLMFPGRTEYVEKYANTAEDFAAHGLASIAVDWRGQGLADRMLDDRRIGHVMKFTDYQMDVAAVVAALTDLDLPQPWYVLGHSMGGAIGLRAVLDGLPVARCAFTGPMWGISLSPFLRALGLVLPNLARVFGFEGRKAPTTRYEHYVLSQPFQDNVLTTDAEMFALMGRQLRTHPQLALGGPSLNWVREALDEADALAAMPSPDLPCICVVGDNERIVDIPRAADRMDRWPGGTLYMAPGAEHEVLMETPDIRRKVVDRIVGTFLDDKMAASA